METIYWTCGGVVNMVKKTSKELNDVSYNDIKIRNDYENYV